KILPITIAAFVASPLLMPIFTLLAELFSGRAMRPAYAPAVEPHFQDEPAPAAAAAPVEEVVEAAPVMEPVADTAWEEPQEIEPAPRQEAPAEVVSVPEKSMGEELR